MRACHRWLEELTGLDLDPADVARRLTGAGIEVEETVEVGRGLDGVVAAEVRAVRAHPERAKLSLVTVADGEGEQEVVCGAPNVPEPGGRVVLATLGAKLPGGLEIGERKLAGVVSRGMLCSEVELDVGSDESGILVLGDDTPAAPGTPVARALSLSDTVYELGLTPNRPDCLGHLGLARELCALYEADFAPPAPEAPGALAAAPPERFPQHEAVVDLGLGPSGAAEPTGFGPVRVDIADPARCPRYGAALVGGVTIGPSPFALRYRLHLLGLRAISNVVDATNLILLGFGHPIHAFDYDRLRGSRIQVRLATAGERMRTLDGADHALSRDDLLICDGDGPVALAGVMGGESSEIGPDTERVLIECAYFDPRSVRRTSKRTGLHTDSSHRFERGVDPDAVPAVLAHAASTIARLSGGTALASGLDVHPAPGAPRAIDLRMPRVEALLGVPFEASGARAILGRLGCQVQAGDGERLEVLAPSHRPDLQREVDLIEELARVRGYDAIPTQLPRVLPSGRGAAEVGFLRRLRELAAAAGLDEAVHYAFLSPQQLEAARVPTDAVRLQNPLSEERSVMRTCLLPGLATGLRAAQGQRLDRFAQFELGRVFHPAAGGDRPEPGPLPRERHELGLLLWGRRGGWVGDDEPLGFYDAKGAVEAIVRPLSGRPPRCQRDDEGLDRIAPFLHPRRRARVLLADRPVGILGELHPEVVEALSLEGRPLFAALDGPSLAAACRALGPPHVRDLPRFPAATRDLAVVVPEAVESAEVQGALAEAGGALLEQARLFDIYRGEPVPAGHKSLAFHVLYRDPERTLTDKAVDKLHARVVKAAEQRFGASVRR